MPAAPASISIDLHQLSSVVMLSIGKLRFLERTKGARALTLLHGDYHVLGNILFSPGNPSPRVIGMTAHCSDCRWLDLPLFGCDLHNFDRVPWPTAMQTGRNSSQGSGRTTLHTCSFQHLLVIGPAEIECCCDATGKGWQRLASQITLGTAANGASGSRASNLTRKPR